MNDMSDASACANCGLAIGTDGQKFCPNCGQPTPAHRIDWHFLGHELEHGVWHVDRGFFFTLKQLMLRPGHFIRGYLQGRRAGHVKPVPLLLMSAAIVLLLGHYLLDGDVTGSSFTLGMEEGMRGNPGSGKVDPQLVAKVFGFAKDWLNRHITLVTLLLLPFEAAAFKLAFRRVGQVNYPEWLVICTFLTAQTFVIWALFVPLQRRWPDAQPLMMLVAIAYGLCSLAQFFQGYPRWKTLLRGLLGYGVYNVISGVLTLIVAMVMGYLLASGRMQLPG